MNTDEVNKTIDSLKDFVDNSYTRSELEEPIVLIKKFGVAIKLIDNLNQRLADLERWKYREENPDYDAIDL